MTESFYVALSPPPVFFLFDSSTMLSALDPP